MGLGILSSEISMEEDLKDSGIVITIYFPFNSLIGPIQKPDGSWGLIVDYSKLNQIVAAIAVAVLDVVALLDRIR